MANKNQQSADFLKKYKANQGSGNTNKSSNPAKTTNKPASTKPAKGATANQKTSSMLQGNIDAWRKNAVSGKKSTGGTKQEQLLGEVVDYLKAGEYDPNKNAEYTRAVAKIGTTYKGMYDAGSLNKLSKALTQKDKSVQDIGGSEVYKAVQDLDSYGSYVQELQKQASEAQKNRGQAWWQNVGNILANAGNALSGNTFMPADTNIYAGAKAKAEEAQKAYEAAQGVYNQAKSLDLQSKYGGYSYSYLKREAEKYPEGSFERQWIEDTAQSKKTVGNYKTEIRDIDAQIEELQRTNHYAYEDYNSQTGETYQSGGVNDRKIIELKLQKNALMGEMSAAQGKIEDEKTKKLSDFKSLSEVPEDYYASIFNADSNYNYINDVKYKNGKSYRDSFGSNILTVGAQGASKIENWTLYDQMTDEEKQLYNYYYNNGDGTHKPGKESGDAYLDRIRWDLSQREANKEAEAFQEFTRNHYGLANTLDLGMSLASGAGYADVAGQYLKNAITGEYNRINYNTPGMRLAKNASIIKNTTAQDITDATGVIDLDEAEHPILAPVLNGKSLGDVYQLGMSTLESMAAGGLSMATGIPNLNSFLLGSSAATQAMIDALERGATDEQALAIGGLDGIMEGFWEKYSWQQLIKNGPHPGLQALTEGTEEFNTSLADEFIERMILGENSSFRKAVEKYKEQGEEKPELKAWEDLGVQLLWDFVGGTAMGAFSDVAYNSIGNASRAITDNRAYKGNASEIVNTGDALRAMQESAGLNDSAETADNVLEYLSGKKTADTAETLSSTVDALRSKIEAGEKVTNKDVRTAQEQIDKATRQVVENAIKESLSGTGNEQRASQIADAIFEGKGISAKKGTAWIGQNEGLNKAYRAGMNSYADMLELADQAAKLTKQNEEAAKNGKTENAFNAEQRANALRSGADVLRSTKNLDRNAPIASNGDRLSNVTGIKVDGDKVSATLSTGETVNLDDLNMVERPGTSDEASFGYQIKRLVKSYGEASQAVYQGFLNSNMTLSAYLDVADRITTIAKSSSLGYAEGIKALRNSKLVQGLSNLQQEHLWSIGKGLVVKQKAATKKSSYKDVDVSTEDIEIGGEKYKGASDMEAGYKDLAAKIAKASKGNLSFHFFHGGEGNNTNGFYQSGVVYINVDAVRDGKSLVSYTMSHELTHFIQEYNADAYKKLKDFVVKKLTKKKGKTLNALVLEKQARDKGISYEDALDEVVADGCEMMLQNSNILEELAVQDQSLAKTVISHAKAFLKRVTSGLNPIHDEAKELMKYADQLQKMWDKALAEAITSEQEKIARSREGKVQYSDKDKEEILHLKQQIRDHLDELNKMQPVADVESEIKFDLENIQAAVNWASEKLGLPRKGYIKISREGSEDVKISRKRLNRGFNYLPKANNDETRTKMGQAYMLAAAAIPSVIKDGKEIEEHKNHKKYGYSTKTYAARVVLDGKPGIMSVVVKMTTDLFYDVHSILTPEGDLMVLDYNDEADALTGGVSESEPVAPAMLSASKKIITEEETESKRQKSVSDAEYLNAVKEGDLEKAENMVAEAARKKGYTTKVYHGSRNFGDHTVLSTESVEGRVTAEGTFVKYSWSPYFATDSLDIARTYSAAQGVRRISETGPDVTEAKIKDLRSKYDAAIDDMAKEISSYMGYEYSATILQEELAEYFTNIVEGYDQGEYEQNIDDYIYRIQGDLYYEKVEEDEDEEIADEINNMLWEAEDKLLNVLNDTYQLVASPGGNYEYWANTDNFVEIDAKGEKWNNLSYKDKNSLTTREVAALARDDKYSGVIIRNVRDDGGKGGKRAPAGTVYIFFDPSKQVKSADPVTYDDRGEVIPLSERFNEENNDIRFSMKDPVEETQKLVAVHNKSVSGLRRMLARNGVPFPSIAIKKAGSSHEGFGDVSIVFPRSTIDPKANRDNRLYSNDAWTPTEPRVEYDVGDAYQYNKAVRGEIGDDIFYGLRGSGYLESNELENRLGRESGDVAEALKDISVLKYAYLKSIGQEPRIPAKAQTLYPNGKFKNDYVMEVFDEMGRNAMDDIENGGDEERAKIQNILAQKYEQEMAARLKNADKSKVLNMLKNNNPYRDQYIWLDEFQRAWNTYKNNGYLIKAVDDFGKLDDDLRANKDLEKDKGYRKWIEDKFSDLIKDTGIPNGKGIYTDSGNRRSFKQRHIPATMANIVSQMKKEQERGIGVAGINLRGAATKTYSDVEEMRKDSGRLLGAHVFDEEYDSYMSNFMSRLSGISGKAAKRQDWETLDSAQEILLEAVRDAKTKAEMDRKLQREAQWINYSADLTEELWQLKQDVQNMPAPYFEAKPRRVVYPDEALAYILPDNAGEDLIKELTDRGYNVLTYKNGDEADRLEKLNSVEDARFSRADITDDELTEALADEDYERAERVANNDAALSRKALKHDLLNRFSIPEGLREKLGKKIDSFADDILRDGVVNENTKEDLYNDLYDAGIIKMPAEETATLAAEQMRGSRLYVPDAVKDEFSGDYNIIRRKLMGYKVYLTTNERDMGVDTLNAEMAEQFPHLFDATNSDERVILEDILDIFENQAKDKEYTLDEYAEMMRKTEGLDIESQQESLERGFDYAVQAFTEKAELEFTLRNRLAGKLTREGEAKLQQRIKDLKAQRKDLRQAEEDLEKKVRTIQRERDRAQEQVLFYRNQLSVNKNFKKAKPEDVNRFTRNLLESDLWWPVRTQARDIYADMNAIASNLMNGKTDIYEAAYNIAAKCINSAIDVYGKDGRQDDYISALTSEIISGLFDADVRQEYTYAERMQNRLERAKADNKELKAKYQALKKQQAERRKASKYKQQILKLYDTANKMLTSPKKSITGHAATDLMRAVAEMCQYIGTAQDKFYTNKYEALDKLIDEQGSTETRVNRERHLKKTIQQLSELQFRYNQVKNDPMYNYEYDESVNEMLNTLKDTLSGNTLDDLESDKLREIYDAMSALMKTVTEANKLTALNTEKTVLEFAKEAGADIDKAQAIKNETLRDYMNKQKSPDVMFNYFGGYKKGSSFNKMQQMFVDSMRRYLEVKKQFQEIFDESITNNKEFKQMMYEPTKHLVDWGLKDQDGNAVATSRGMMLAAYKLLLQEDSFNAIAKAGFQIPKIEAFYKDDMARAFGGGDDAKFYSQNRAQDLYAIVDRLQELDTQEEDLKADKANISSEEYNKQLNSIESQKRQQLRRWGNIFEEECAKLEELKSNIEDQLTDFEKEFLAKADQWYTHSDDLRNEVNLALYGFVKPGVKNYTPIHRDLAEVQMDIRTDNTDAPANLENAGFNKERVKARAPIQLTDINFDLLHSSEGIARFYGFTEAQRTFNKIYNAKVLGSGKDRNGQDITVKSKIGNKFGTGNRKWLVTGNQYIENYIRSIAGSNFSRENKFGKVYGHVARANLTLNLRVAVSQLASIPTAAAVLGWDNVLRGMGQGIGYAFSSKQKDQLAEKSIYFWQRYKGDGGMPEYSDASRGAGVIDRLYNRLQNTKVGHALLDWCKIMDCAATSMMYPMAEAYVNQHFGDLEGEAREAKIIEIYEETLRKTQPNYTETERSDLLRDKTMAMKIFTMFKTQSNQNLNLLINANGELRRVIRDKANGNATQAEVQEAKRNFANSFTAVVLGGSLAFAVLRMMSNFILGTLSGYRDDDDELTEESVLKGLGKEVLSSLAGNFMGGSMVFDFVWARVNHESYYGISDNAMGAISDLVDSAFKLQVTPDEGSKEPWAKVISSWTKFALEVCDFAGIPVSNAKKITEAGEMWANDLKNGTFGKFEGNVERTDAQNYNIIIKRFLNEDYAGSQEMYDSMFTSWGEKQDVEAGMKRSIKDKFIEGHITADDAMSLLLSYVMDDENDAADLITEWRGVIDTGYTYNDIQEAYMEGSATANDLRDYMATYKFMGKDAIEKKINELDFEADNGFAPSKLKEAYVEGEITAQEAAKYYHEVYGKDLDDAKVRVSEWQAYKDTGIEYSEIEDAYYDGKITYNQVVNMLKKYGDKSNSEYSNNEQAVRYADKWRFNKENPKYAGELDVNQVSRWYSEYKGKVKIDKFMMYLDFIGNGYHGDAPSQAEILEWMPSHLTYEEALALWTYKGWSTSNKNMKKLTNAYGK